MCSNPIFFCSVERIVIGMPPVENYKGTQGGMKRWGTYGMIVCEPEKNFGTYPEPESRFLIHSDPLRKCGRK